MTVLAQDVDVSYDEGEYGGQRYVVTCPECTYTVEWTDNGLARDWERTCECGYYWTVEITGRGEKPCP
jgi:hypothetical protein